MLRGDTGCASPVYSQLMQRPFVLAAESDISFNETTERLCDALRAQFGCDENGCPRFYMQEAFPTYVIVRASDGDGLYRVPYTMSPDSITFGDAQEVETAYVPVAEACVFLAGEGESADDGAYPIAIIKPGWAGGAINGQALPHFYTPEFCAQVAEAAQGVPFGRKHPDQRGPDPTGALDPDRIAGFVGGGVWDGTQAKGVVNLFAAESALRSRLNEARQTKTLKNFGVSMLASVAGKVGKKDGRDALIVDKLGQLYSVDLVARAGAGGQFLAAAGTYAGSDIAAAQLAAVKPNSTAIAPSPGPGHKQRTHSVAAEGATMNKTLKQLLDALTKKDPAKAAGFFSRAVLASEAEQTTIQDEVIAALGDVPAPVATMAIAAEAATALADLHRAQSRNRIESKLTESKLSEPAKTLVRSHLEVVLAAEANVQDAAIDGEIANVRTAFAAFEGVGRVRQGSVVLDSRDKLVLATEAMLGVRESQGKGVPAFRGIREAYTKITGDTDLSQLSSGRGFSGVLASEAVVTGDFPNILLDAMHKMLAQEWAELALGGLEGVATSVSLDDYRLRNVVRDGYFPEMPVVAEGAPYVELAYPTDERIDYAPSKRGGLLTISEETIRNDDLGAVARWPGKLARGARNGLRSFMVNFFVNNPNYGGDGVAIFNAAHSNLLSLALGQAGLTAAQLALRLQTERDSGEVLGLPLSWIAVPAALEATAIQINQTNTAGENAFFHRFGPNNERIFVVSRLVDANDWYYGTDVNLAPFFEMGYLDGKQQPEIFLANQPTVGTQFTADELQYKVKFVYGGAFTDFRGVGKSVVA